MKSIYTLLFLILISGLTHSQDEIRISQSVSSKYVEPYLAVNPLNGDILAIYFIQGSEELYITITDQTGKTILK
jgi:hypothetical protein